MGVTPTNGGPMPRYMLKRGAEVNLADDEEEKASTHPFKPSLARVCLTTSKAPLYVPAGAVCMRVFVRSNG